MPPPRKRPWWPNRAFPLIWAAAILYIIVTSIISLVGEQDQSGRLFNVATLIGAIVVLFAGLYSMHRFQAKLDKSLVSETEEDTDQESTNPANE